MKNSEPDIPVECVDGDIAVSLSEECDEYREADQEINNPPAYKGETAAKCRAPEQYWSNPLGYTPGIW